MILAFAMICSIVKLHLRYWFVDKKDEKTSSSSLRSSFSYITCVMEIFFSPQFLSQKSLKSKNEYHRSLHETLPRDRLQEQPPLQHPIRPEILQTLNHREEGEKTAIIMGRNTWTSFRRNHFDNNHLPSFLFYSFER